MNELITLIGILLIWISYSILEGHREGYYWHYKMLANDSYEVDLHKVFSAQRGLVIALIFILMFFGGYSFLASSLIALANMLLFSFFHNGSMYATRNDINPKLYQLRWFDQSNSSTALMTKLMTLTSRTIQAVLGIALYLITYLFFIL